MVSAIILSNIFHCGPPYNIRYWAKGYYLIYHDPTYITKQNKIKGKIMTTFEIANEIRELENKLNEIDPVTGEYINSEDKLKEYIQDLRLKKEEKLNNIQDLKSEYNSSVEAINKKIESLQKRKHSLLTTINRMTELQLLLLDGEKFKTDEYTFSFRNSKSVFTPSIVNKDCPYLKVKYEYDKTALKKALETGEDLSKFDIHFIEKQALSIR